MKTPKEEAIELVGIFELATGSKVRGIGCAFICIDRILDAYYPLEYYPEDLKDYWEEVKQEIEKL